MLQKAPGTKQTLQKLIKHLNGLLRVDATPAIPMASSRLTRSSFTKDYIYGEIIIISKQSILIN